MNSLKYLVGAAALTTTVGLGATARAEAPDVLDAPVAALAGAPTERMTLPAGRVLITADLAINLSKDLAFKPLSLSPDLWYGVSDKLTVGLVHSGRGGSGLVGAVGNSLCLAGESNGCAKVYDDVGADVRYQVKDAPGGGLGVAVDGGVFASSFDPFTLALKLGVIGHVRHGKLGVDVAPALTVGLTERDGGNKEVLTLPISVMYSVAPKVALSAQAGLVLPFENAGDNFAVPLSLGASFAVTSAAYVSAAFTLPAVVAGDAYPDAFDLRTFTLGGGYAL